MGLLPLRAYPAVLREREVQNPHQLSSLLVKGNQDPEKDGHLPLVSQQATELSPWKACPTQLSAAPRILISTLGLPHLALPWRPATEFPQTDIPAWPVCSCPKPLEVGDRWDHTWEKTLLAHLTHCGEKKKTGSQEPGQREESESRTRG